MTPPIAHLPATATPHLHGWSVKARGTRDMVRKARAAGIETIVIGETAA